MGLSKLGLDARLSQTELARRLGRYQSVVAAIEGGGRRIDVVELLDLADAIGFDAREVIDELYKVPSQTPPRTK